MRKMTRNMERWLEALRRSPSTWVAEIPNNTGRALVRRGLAEEKISIRPNGDGGTVRLVMFRAVVDEGDS